MPYRGADSKCEPIGCHFFVGSFFTIRVQYSFQLRITAYHDDGANMKRVQEKYYNRVQLRFWRWLSHSIRERLYWRGFLVVFKSRNITMQSFHFEIRSKTVEKYTSKRDKNFMSFFVPGLSKGKLVYCLRSIASPAIFMFETDWYFFLGYCYSEPFFCFIYSWGML